MDERETEALMDDISAVMKALVARATKPLIAKIDALEGKIASIPAPVESKALAADIAPFLPDNTDKTVAPLLKQIEALKAEIDTLKQQPAPKEVRPEDVAAIIAGNFRKDIDDLRASLSEVTSATQKAVDAHGAKLAVLVKDEVGSVLAGWEKPKDGRDGVDGAPGTKGDPGSAGKDGQDGRNGVGLAGAMIDRAGALIITLSDGTTRELGHVVGKDADMVTVKSMIDETTRKAVADVMATIEMPKDGRDGIDGKDGAAGMAGKDGMNGADGKDGAPGRDGKDAEPITKQQIIEAVLTTDALSTAVEQYLSDNPPQAGKDGLDGKNGQDGAPGAPGPSGEKGDPGEPGQAGADGRDGTNGVDGKSVTIEDVRPLIEAEVTKAVTLITVKDGVDGKDGVSLEELVPVIEDRVQKASAAIHVPKDGKDGATVEELLPHINDTIAKAVSALPLPKDGKDGRDAIDVKDLLVVEGGDLVATFTDGRVKVLGPFRGKDGAPGEPGKDGRDIDPQVVEKLIDEKIAKVAPPEIERDAYLADVSRMIEEAAAKHAPVEEEEFAPDEVAANIALAVKMMAERPAPRVIEPEQKAQPSPTINFAFSDNREPTVVNVAPPSINIEAKRGKEVTKVTGYDENGRIKSFEKTEVDE